jgi:hypothetical protein
MLTHFKIDYKGWSDEASPINPDIKVKTSHAKLVANAEISERNKDPKFRQKVSKGVSKHFGSIEERFISKLTKVKGGCIEYPNRWICSNGKQTQPKQFAAEYYKLGFTKEMVVQKCGNPKCVNPNHLIEMSRDEQASNIRKKKALMVGDNHPNRKLKEKDVRDIMKMYRTLLKERGGKHKGIASIIHKKYPNVTLSTLCSIIKNNH